jgi:hypothetical protein
MMADMNGETTLDSTPDTADIIAKGTTNNEHNEPESVSDHPANDKAGQRKSNLSRVPTDKMKEY